MKIFKVGIALIFVLLCACQTTPDGKMDHDAYCREMKHKLIFSGNNTSHQDIIWSDRMDKPKLAESYHQAGC